MNIVTPLPTAVPFVTSNVNTEAARRDNSQREVIPQPNQSENSAAESGVGSEADRARPAGLQPQPVTYERPLPQTAENTQTPAENAGAQGESGTDADNAEDPSAGRESAEQRQQEQQKLEEDRKINELKERDREVRAHEQAHASVGGQYAGSPQYEFERGPDGRQYAVGGEVSIDISEESTPEKTLDKMNQVKAAALAPTEPSAQDLKVAGEATQKASEARAQIAQNNAEVLRGSGGSDASPANVASGNAETAATTINGSEVAGTSSPNTSSVFQVPELDDIVSQNNQSASVSVRRSLQGFGSDTASLESAGFGASAASSRSLQTPSDEGNGQSFANRDDSINRRAARIANFYQQATEPTVNRIQQSA